MTQRVFTTDHPASRSPNGKSRHNLGTSSKELHEVQEYGAPEKGLKVINALRLAYYPKKLQTWW